MKRIERNSSGAAARPGAQRCSLLPRKRPYFQAQPAQPLILFLSCKLRSCLSRIKRLKSPLSHWQLIRAKKPLTSPAATAVGHSSAEQSGIYACRLKMSLRSSILLHEKLNRFKSCFHRYCISPMHCVPIPSCPILLHPPPPGCRRFG